MVDTTKYNGWVPVGLSQVIESYERYMMPV